VATRTQRLPRHAMRLHLETINDFVAPTSISTTTPLKVFTDFELFESILPLMRNHDATNTAYLIVEWSEDGVIPAEDPDVFLVSPGKTNRPVELEVKLRYASLSGRTEAPTFPTVSASWSLLARRKA